jgi:alkyl sulfatase BDS1-like metallo-beta-lactamase superfamily hydrolase
MAFFEKFQNTMLQKYENKNREFKFLFVVVDLEEKYVVEVSEAEECTISVCYEDNDEFDLVIEAEKKIFEKIIDDDNELTGVDAYFEGDLELEGDRTYLEDLFEVFGIV